MYVDDIKLAGKKQNIDPMWKELVKDFDLGEPTSFLDHVCLGCTQRECQISKDIVNNYKSMLESRISAGTKENYQKQKPRGNLIDAETISSWSSDMEGHANWQKTLSNYTKSRRTQRKCETSKDIVEKLQKHV